MNEGYVYGALARAEALAADHPDWMNVTRWPIEHTPATAAPGMDDQPLGGITS